MCTLKKIFFFLPLGVAGFFHYLVLFAVSFWSPKADDPGVALAIAFTWGVAAAATESVVLCEYRISIACNRYRTTHGNLMRR